jgi:hypothetical protein
MEFGILFTSHLNTDTDLDGFPQHAALESLHIGKTVKEVLDRDLQAEIEARTLALPNAVAHWSLTSMREKLIKIGAKIVTHARYIIFQMAEVAVPRELFREILRLIEGLRPPPVLA